MSSFHTILGDSDLLGSLKIHMWQRAGGGREEGKIFNDVNGN